VLECPSSSWISPGWAPVGRSVRDTVPKQVRVDALDTTSLLGAPHIAESLPKHG
jgi:hypothetical protein